MGSTEHLDCSTLLRYFDELNESTNRVSTADFRNHLLRWGMPKDTVKSYMAQFDPKKTGYITRRDLCNALNYYPNRRSFLKDVHIIESDAPQHQRESIISIILGEMKHDGQPKEKLYRAKKRIEKLYGKEWNIFQAYGSRQTSGSTTKASPTELSKYQTQRTLLSRHAINCLCIGETPPLNDKQDTKIPFPLVMLCAKWKINAF
uniref:Tegumental antigen n=1 Tax=Echinococcus granulosus TaxID=6210 RepID=A0A068WI01_ECHGR|nr:tegumental antigen [Echinococcus granulosus]